MNRWKALALGALAMLLTAAPPAEAAEESTASVAAVNPQAEREAARAAKAAERAQRQADRAAAKADLMRARAEKKAARAGAPNAASDTGQAAETPAAPISVQEGGAVDRVPAAENTALPDPKAARAAEKLEREQAIAARKAERAAAREERKAALAAAKEEKRAEAAAAREAKRAERAEKIATNKRDRGSRYKTIFTDNGFTYYLDVKNTRWVPRPYSSSEYMIDAWVRLVENTTGEPVAEDGKIRPAKYFLEHYYISPERRQIMFMSELEVTGRPDNAVKERAYDPRNWEQLVPGSVEDELYGAITAQMKSAPGQRHGLLSGTSGMSLRDMIEEYARVSF